MLGLVLAVGLLLELMLYLVFLLGFSFIGIFDNRIHAVSAITRPVAHRRPVPRCALISTPLTALVSGRH